MSFRKSDCELIEQLCELRHHIQEYHWNQLFLYSSVFFRVSAQELKFFFLCVCVIDFYHCQYCTQLRTLDLVLDHKISRMLDPLKSSPLVLCLHSGAGSP